MHPGLGLSFVFSLTPGSQKGRRDVSHHGLVQRVPRTQTAWTRAIANVDMVAALSEFHVAVPEEWVALVHFAWLLGL